MTFKDLKKRFSSGSTAENNNIISTSSNKFDIFKDKPFWISNVEEHKAEDIRTRGYCCFNHIIGLPKKDGIEKPIFDYETDLVKNLEEYRSVWIKKSRGLGVTEIILRYISWLCTRNNDDYKGKRIHIVTGPRINLAEDLIDRIHNLFELQN